MKKNITQKAISVKLDLELIEPLEQYCASQHLKKNKAINIAIAHMVGATR